MTAEECKAYYEQNEDFKRYVDRCVENDWKIGKDGIFDLKIVQNVAEYYKAKEGA